MLVFASLALAACGRYPEEGRAYHVDRYAPDASSSPVISFTTSTPPPPLLGGVELFAPVASSSAAPAPPPAGSAPPAGAGQDGAQQPAPTKPEGDAPKP